MPGSSSLQPDQNARLREIFDALGDQATARAGRLIGIDGVGTALQLFGLELPPEEADSLPRTSLYPIASDLSCCVAGKLRFEEFVHTILTQPTPGTSSEEEIAAIYDLFSQQGVVTATSVQAAMEALSQPVSALLATDIVREADLDEDGVVSRDDFSQAALQ
ncbi:hypothetical protein EMIHUDRAFT_224779 [Emiliania huxleyi CCMP1516]|uniref:EF-hand domain-containing protein n=2 Tax=Emiliania huxleyi TaxID=2903 RepID=A0A0D3KJV8_EMIH1|nr:hypothetical protein EMIHUDRAFT_226894 [Emiliania huxleyi CCMP1516]XP_005790794.1 hypothetical protein EMIHUDRAFT_224779 [Emiliania huxleyi CCMP1516]EOD36043.1 hypothetical protein EMIHUDRAFT_226894 [Emiliania huxleyi CCMP1516]EOD38365.1 hypothetical protein EMIHUDRAFT_224779 [Emiliania huxleyi CCMP1516]|eukprot:XP_005788472.1 hypothetical protein EMIHUDRAFT_226894 [Emiliania huxleyi CCMP1516]